MTETSKGNEIEEARGDKPAKDGRLSIDQKERPYYYDDACGYEEYREADDNDDDDAEEDLIS